jgi:hypothetical protein
MLSAPHNIFNSAAQQPWFGHTHGSETVCRRCQRAKADTQSCLLHRLLCTVSNNKQTVLCPVHALTCANASMLSRRVCLPTACLCEAGHFKTCRDATGLQGNVTTTHKKQPAAGCLLVNLQSNIRAANSSKMRNTT